MWRGASWCASLVRILRACSAPATPSSALLSAGWQVPHLQLMSLWLWESLDGEGSMELASWLCPWCWLLPQQDVVSPCASPSLSLSPQVPPAPLTSASPHPALGDHLPFCNLHPRLCAGGFKALLSLLLSLSFRSAPSCPPFPHALSSSPFVQGLLLSLFFIIND